MAGVNAMKQLIDDGDSTDSKSIRFFGPILWLQGGYYLLTGVWPLVSIRSFIWVTGEKTDHLVTGREADHWLVMTAGVLVTAIAAALLVAAYRRRYSPEIITLAVGAAIGLTAIDVIYVSRQVIAPIYLVDAVLQTALIAAWGLALLAQPLRRGLAAPINRQARSSSMG